MRWGLLCSLILSMMGVLPDGNGTPEVIPAQSVLYSFDAHQSVSKRILNSDLTSINKVLGDFEVEEEDDNHSSEKVFSQSFSPLQARIKLTRASLFIPQKVFRLYVLFHSWKSFLFI